MIRQQRFAEEVIREGEKLQKLAEEQKHRSEEAARWRAEEERKLKIEVQERTLHKECVYCGQPLGVFDKLLNRTSHRGCYSRGVFTTKPTEQQITNSAFPLELEKDIPNLVASFECICGGRFQVITKYSIFVGGNEYELGGKTIRVADFFSRTCLIAICKCYRCKKTYYVATAPRKIQRHWIS